MCVESYPLHRDVCRGGAGGDDEGRPEQRGSRALLPTGDRHATFLSSESIARSAACVPKSARGERDRTAPSSTMPVKAIATKPGAPSSVELPRSGNGRDAHFISADERSRARQSRTRSP